MDKLLNAGKSAPKPRASEFYKGLEYTFIAFDEVTEMAYYDPWDKPPKDPNRFEPDSPFKGEPRWLREKREKDAYMEQELLRQLEKKLRHAMNYGYTPPDLRLKPEPKPIVIGDYLLYYLGGPNNATQEYFFNERLPQDQSFRDIAELTPVAFSPEPDPRPSIRHRYKLVVIPQHETPFATVQVYLALYQELPL